MVSGGETQELAAELGKLTHAKVQVMGRPGDGCQATVEQLLAAIEESGSLAPRLMLLVDEPDVIRVIELR